MSRAKANQASKSKAKPPEGKPIQHVFTRPIMLHVCKDGTVTYRDKTKGEKVFNGVALPVFSVDTIEEARRIQTRFCRKQYTRHPHRNGPEDWYVLNAFSGELSGLDLVSAEFATFYAEHIKKTDEWKRWAAKLRDQLIEKSKRYAEGAE